MATSSIGHSGIPPLEYNEYLWGDCITGTKAQLQDLGLGLGHAFPGEPGGPKRVLSVIDPRGLKARIQLDYDRVRYCARIQFPGRDCHWHEWQPFAPGVQRACFGRSDHFRGTAPALVAAGLVAADQFPGMPGMRKMRVTIYADGTIPQVPATSNVVKHPGDRTVERKGVNTYEVSVRVDEDVAKRRIAADLAARYRWEADMRSLPRPAKLQAIGTGIVQRWSAPPVQTLQPAPSTPLFDLNPAEAKAREAFAQHAMKTLRELVDYSQESVYEGASYA